MIKDMFLEMYKAPVKCSYCDVWFPHGLQSHICLNKLITEAYRLSGTKPVNNNKEKSMIRFELETEACCRAPQFKDVAQEQFFIGRDGRLYQKVNHELAHCIAKSDGTPFATREEFNATTTISQILPKVTKIHFG